MLTLVIGNKNFSSWSLRPWLLLKHIGEPFREQHIRLYMPDTQQHLLAANPAGKVPVLFHDNLRVHDSLAICEYLNELFPASKLWPDDVAERAEARAVSAEMHSGFLALRGELPFNVTLRTRHQPSPEAAADIRRICDIWQQLRQRHVDGGPWLFGRFSIADAMFAPVACRFVSYGIELPPLAAAYADHVLADAALLEWFDAAETEQAATLA
ncbi:glutathione S-transferase family protein [Vogesella sp. GCM10023246]|uniref:Glutathione S-transferase family protein n=1 Tax=Vogesella oryzagri TaxID=3160864 RepID=A0ABV1M5W0_9NEIS